MENIKNQSTDNPDQTYDYIKEPLLFRNFRSNPINVHGVWNAVYIVKSKVDKFSNWEKIYNATSATITTDGNTYISPVAKIKINSFLDYYFPFEAPVFIEKNLDLLLTEKLQKTADVNLDKLNTHPISNIEKETSTVDLTNTSFNQEVENIKSPLDIKAQFEKLTQPISISNIPTYKPNNEKTISAVDLSNLALDQINITENNIKTATSNYDDLVQEKTISDINLENVRLCNDIVQQTPISSIPLSNISTSISTQAQKTIADVDLANLVTTPVITNVTKQIENIRLNNLISNKQNVAVQTKIADINLQDLVLNKEAVLPSEISPIILSNIITFIPTIKEKEVANVKLENLIATKPIIDNVEKQIQDIDLSNILVSTINQEPTEIADINLQNLTLTEEIIAQKLISPVILNNISTTIQTNTTLKEVVDIELEDLIIKQPIITHVQKEIADILLSDLLISTPEITETEIADIYLPDLAVNKEIVLSTEISPIILNNISTSIPTIEQKEIANIQLQNIVTKQPIVNNIEKEIADIELSNLILQSITKIQEEIIPDFIQLEQGTELLEQPIKEAVYIEKEVPIKVENTVYVPVEINKVFEVVKEVEKYIEVEHYAPAKVIEKDVVKWHDNVSYIELPEQAKTQYIEIQHEVPVEVVKEVNIPVFVEKPVVEQVQTKIEEDKPLITPSDIDIYFEVIQESNKTEEEPKEVEPIDVSSDIDSTNNISAVDSDEEDATVVPIDDDVEEFDDYYDDEDEAPTKSRRKRNTKPYLTLYNGNKPLSSNNIIDKYNLDEETLGTVSQTPKNLKQRKRTKK